MGNRMFQSSTASLAGQLRHAGGSQAQMETYGRMYRGMLNQAATLSYIDTFWLLGVVTGIMFLLSFLLRSNHPRKADAQAMAH
jgi:DHA2 family multidrug resistance protein